MILINIENKSINRDYIENFELQNIDCIYFNFNISQDKLKINSDRLLINNNHLEIFRSGYPLISIDVDEVQISKILSYIPLDKEINGLIMHEIKYEYIISFKKVEDSKKSKISHIYISDRNPIDYTYIKK